MRMKIFLDPGHGGTDPGAVYNGVKEKDLNLTVAMNIKELLVAAGLEVKMSRESDSGVGLTERCDMANIWGADFFISIHHNAGGGDGFELIHTIHTLYSQGDELANAIGQEFLKTGQNLRCIYSRESTNYPGQDYYTVIQGTAMAAVISEYAFIDTKDYEAVDTIEELHTEAKAIADGVCNHLGIEGKKKDWEKAYKDLADGIVSLIEKYKGAN
jgi:N-acetylmuramoyl-L-alanine amidase